LVGGHGRASPRYYGGPCRAAEGGWDPFPSVSCSVVTSHPPLKGDERLPRMVQSHGMSTWRGPSVGLQGREAFREAEDRQCHASSSCHTLQIGTDVVKLDVSLGKVERVAHDCPFLFGMLNVRRNLGMPPPAVPGRLLTFLRHIPL
jgi:hypothetical protein